MPTPHYLLDILITRKALLIHVSHIPKRTYMRTDGIHDGCGSGVDTSLALGEVRRRVCDSRLLHSTPNGTASVSICVRYDWGWSNIHIERNRRTLLETAAS
jgi:hypothetical protein